MNGFVNDLIKHYSELFNLDSSLKEVLNHYKQEIEFNLKHNQTALLLKESIIKYCQSRAIKIEDFEIRKDTVIFYGSNFFIIYRYIQNSFIVDIINLTIYEVLHTYKSLYSSFDIFDDKVQISIGFYKNKEMRMSFEFQIFYEESKNIEIFSCKKEYLSKIGMCENFVGLAQENSDAIKNLMLYEIALKQEMIEVYNLEHDCFIEYDERVIDKIRLTSQNINKINFIDKK